MKKNISLFLASTVICIILAVTACSSSTANNENAIEDETLIESEVDYAKETSVEENFDISDETTDEIAETETAVNQTSGNGELVEINESNFASFTSKGLVLVDFFAPWCGPCKLQKPVLVEVAKEYASQIKIATINTDNNKNISGKFNITGIPCMILFQNGKEVKRIVGYHEKAELLNELSGFIKAPKSALVTITESNFTAETAKGLVLVDFFASWCGPCKMQKPILEEFAKEYAGKIKVGTLDTDKAPNLSNKYQISSIPCMILFKDGKEVSRIIGLHQKAELLQKLSPYLK